MVDLLELQKQFICAHIKAGDIAVDFTMGNGHDTLFLSQTVGQAGHVYAFDIQPEALVSTRARLIAHNAPENYTLICASHHLLRDYLSSPFKAGMFNLGWLPGNGNHEVTTKWETTLPAIEGAISMLAPNGILLVAIYPGHPEGEHEGQALGQYLATLNRKKLCCSRFQIVNSPTSPYFYIIESK